MKAKVTTGKSFKGLMRYAQKDDSSFVSSSTGSDPANFLKTCASLRRARPDIKSPVLHFSLSQPPGERLTDEQWQAVVADFQSELKLEDHDYFAIRHNDKEHDHIHLIVSKIHPTGSLWKDSNSARRAMTACTKIEQKFNLTVTKSLEDFRNETGQRRQKIKDGEMRAVQRTGKPLSARKAAITAKIAKQKQEKESQHVDQNRDAAKTGIANGSGTEQHRADKPTSKPAQRDGSRTSQPQGIQHESDQGILRDQPKTKAVGKITSRRSVDGESVIFKQNMEVIARMTEDQIDVFKIDDTAIRLAIEHAKRAGKIPLRATGTPEFLSKVEEIAKQMRVEVAPASITNEAKPKSSIADQLQKMQDDMNKKIAAENQDRANKRAAAAIIESQRIADQPRPTQHAPAPKI